MKISLKSPENKILVLSFFLFLLTIVPRFYDIHKFLPNYSIDENDIVEFAVGYLGGDFDPHWYKYGPLYGYLLSVIYFIQSFFSTLDLNNFAQKIFFEPTIFYYSARFFNSLLNILIALGTYKLARKFFNKQVAAIAVFIAIFPFCDILTNFKVRIDTLLALWSLVTLYFTVLILETGKQKYYVLSAVFFGLALATKPIPSLLILPTIFLAHFFGYKKDMVLNKYDKKRQKRQKKVVEKNIILKVLGAVFNKKMVLFLFTGILAGIIFNPYSFIKFKAYKAEQVQAVISEGSRNFTAGWDITRFFGFIGYAFIFFAVIAVLYFLYDSIKNKNLVSLVLLSYVVVFWLAFAKGAARVYFYIPIMPIVIIYISKLILEISKRIARLNEKLKYPVVSILLVLLIVQPFSRIYSQSVKLNSNKDYNIINSEFAGKAWIESNLKERSKILLYGYYVSLPRLVDFDINKQAKFGEYFMYFRWNNEYLKKIFSQAHKKYLKERKPVFDLQNIRYDLKEKEKFLYEYCKQNKIEYVISIYDLDKYPDFRNKKIKTFGRAEYTFGTPFSIYIIQN